MSGSRAEEVTMYRGDHWTLEPWIIVSHGVLAIMLCLHLFLIAVQDLPLCSEIYSCPSCTIGFTLKIQTNSV